MIPLQKILTGTTEDDRQRRDGEDTDETENSKLSSQTEPEDQ